MSSGASTPLIDLLLLVSVELRYVDLSFRIATLVLSKSFDYQNDVSCYISLIYLYVNAIQIEILIMIIDNA